MALWPAPKPDTQELIPAQFAKIILSKPPAQHKASASEGNPTQSQSAAVPEKVAKAAVVQAFRAKALSNAVSGLLKGGMTRLLAQSDFVAGRANEARKSFDTKSAALASNGPATGISENTNQAVATLGGSGQGKGAGYGKGEHAGVKGQGAAFVSMDIAGAAVDEGLTKDEVGEVIHRHLSEVRYCYESAMIRTPDLEGKLMTAFVIGGNGVVKSTEVKSSTVPDPRLDDCILRRLATWKFPKPRGGIDVAVAYPFIFKTLLDARRPKRRWGGNQLHAQLDLPLQTSLPVAGDRTARSGASGISQITWLPASKLLRSALHSSSARRSPCLAPSSQTSSSVP